jgi:hypothetical protein
MGWRFMARHFVPSFLDFVCCCVPSGKQPQLGQKMPRIQRSEAVRRLNLELAEPVRARLEELRSELNAESLVEVIRKALSLFDYVWKTKKTGYDLILRSRETGAEQIVEFL